MCSTIDKPIRYTIGNYNISGRSIGKGSFSRIYLGKHKYTKKVVAIKRIRINLENKDQNLPIEREIQIMKTIDHPNIVKMYDILRDSTHIYIILEYCQYGDFSKFLNNRALKEVWAKSFLIQIAKALQYLKSKNIFHRDIKPHNILLTKKYKIKISDFGFAKINNNNLSDTLCGSPLYMAPEILTYKKYTDKADLWSIGVIK